MRRDIGNEVVVAIVAVGVLAFAIAFAIILSLTNTPPTPTVTAVVENPTITPTSQAADTDIPTPTAEVATEAVSTTAAASATPTNTPHTQQPDHTATFTPTPTRPSATPDDTDTPTPTSTLTETAPPSHTPRATETSGIRPTPTGTLTPVTVSSGSSPTCRPPHGWVEYRIQPGNTLYAIAVAVRSNISELREANCLANIDRIQAGDTIFVPRLPAQPVPSNPAATALPDRTGLQAQGCGNPGIQITNIAPGQQVSGFVALNGTASMDQFWYYRIEVRPDFAPVYNFYSRADMPVVQGTLGTIDTSAFGTGLFWIRLTVVDTGGGVVSSPCTIPVFFN